MEYQGEYNDSKQYSYLDVVDYGDAVYVCTNEKILGDNPGVNRGWALVVASTAFKGTYSTITEYKTGDIVLYNGGQYLRMKAIDSLISEVSVGIVPTVTTKWMPYTKTYTPRLVTNGSVNYLVDAQGEPIRQVIPIAQSFVPAVRQSVGDASDTNHVTLANIPVPGGLMGPNGQLRIFLFGQFTTTGTKYLAVDVGGVNIGAPNFSGAQVNCGVLIYFNNAGATNQQKTANAGSHPFIASNNATISSSVNTDVPFNVVAKVKWSAAAGAAGADNFTLLGYTVEAVYAP